MCSWFVPFLELYICDLVPQQAVYMLFFFVSFIAVACVIRMDATSVRIQF